MKKSPPDYALILAAGKGSRMGSDSIHKVCFAVDGTPAILRSLGTYKECGISQNIVVVGTLAGQVVDMVGKEFHNSVFAYQAEANGTAGAIRAALEATCAMPDEADIFVAAGDRLIDASVVESLLELYQQDDCALALLSLPTVPGSGSGRLAVNETGQALAIIEMADVRQRRCRKLFRDLPGTVEIAELQKIALEKFSPKASKCAKAFPEFWGKTGTLTAAQIADFYPENSTYFELSGKIYTPDEVEKFPCSNTSVYLTKRKYLQYVIDHLDRDNAQQEEYLSDIVRLLSANGQVCRYYLEPDRDKVLGFNTPSELLEVSSIIRQKNQHQLPPPDTSKFLPAEQYIEQVKAILQGEKSAPLYQYLGQTYGHDFGVIEGHLKQILPVLELAAQKLPPQSPVAVVRSPGRVNVMGRHVDRQGGNCNLMTINFETLLVVHPRNDDTINLCHLSPEFAPCQFTIAELMQELPWEDWLSVVNSKKLKELIGTYGVDWSHYIKAAVLRLQKKYRTTPLFGMDLFISGDVPMAAGLSSSSSLLVGAAEALIEVNHLNTMPAQLVNLCGEGEWFVGTRGGAADHAAVKLGARNKVVRVKFFDFAVEGEFNFPADHVMVICDSKIKARKSGNAKNQFNHRIACYDLGFKLIKKLYPQYAPMLHHLRDVNAENLHINPARIYEIMLSLPEKATRQELEVLLAEDLSATWATHDEPADGNYPIRAVVLFGLAECARSAVYSQFLAAGDLTSIGKLMAASHNGDRVSQLNEQGEMIPYHYSCDNRTIIGLMEDLRSGVVERVRSAQLCNVPGGYSCSVPAIDRMVDIACHVPGVVGAQLAGAGLGGCMMILAHRDAVPNLKKALIELYYQKANLEPAIYECRPITGAGLVQVN